MGFQQINDARMSLKWEHMRSIQAYSITLIVS